MTTTVTTDLLATLDARYKKLKAEIDEVKRLKAAIKAASSQPVPVRNRTRSAAEGPTFKEMIKAVLSEKGSGAEALEILDLIKHKFGKEIKRTSISPQLSRLKASGDLILEDKVWMLPEHSQELRKSMPGLTKENAYTDEIWDGQLLPTMDGYRPPYQREPRSFVTETPDEPVYRKDIDTSDL